MPGALHGTIEPSGSPDRDLQPRPQPNLKDLAAAAGLSAESGSSDSCGACIGTPRAVSTAGQRPSHQATGPVASRPNAALPGRDREQPPPPLSPQPQNDIPHSQPRSQRYGSINGNGSAGIDTSMQNNLDRDDQQQQQRGVMRATAAAAGAASHAAMMQQLQMLAARGIFAGTDNRETGGDSSGGGGTPGGFTGAAEQADSGPERAGGAAGFGAPAGGPQLLNTHPKAEPYNANGTGGAYGMAQLSQAPAAAAVAGGGGPAAAEGGGGDGGDFTAGSGRRPRKRSAPTDPDGSPQIDRSGPRGEGTPGMDHATRALQAGSLPPMNQHPSNHVGAGAAVAGGGNGRAAGGGRGMRVAATTGNPAVAAAASAAAPTRKGGALASPELDVGDMDDGQDFGGGAAVGAGGPLFAAELPPPVDVTVAVRIGSGRAAEEDARYGNGSYVKGHACGVFEPALYMSRMDCIRYQGTLISRSHFEKIGGSNMAKWYRSIRVLPDLEPLGEWLERHGMPVTKGPARRYRPRKQGGGGGGGAGGGGGNGANSNDGGGEASGGAGGDVEAPPPQSRHRAGSGEVCSSSCGAGAAAQRLLAQQQQAGGRQGNAAFLNQQQQQHLQQHILQQQQQQQQQQQHLLMLAGAQGAAGAAARLQTGSEAGGPAVKAEGGGAVGSAADLQAAAAAMVAGPASEDEAEGTAALISLSMQGANGLAAQERAQRGASLKGHSPTPPVVQRRQGPTSPPPPPPQQQQQQPQAQAQQQPQQPQPNPPPQQRSARQGSAALFKGVGTAMEYDGEGEGKDDGNEHKRHTSEFEDERDGGGGGGAGDFRRQNGVPRGEGAMARRGGGGAGDGPPGRLPPQRGTASHGPKDFSPTMTAAGAAARSDAAAPPIPPPPQAMTGPAAAAARRGPHVGNTDRGERDLMDDQDPRAGPVDPKFPHASMYGADEDDVDRDGYDAGYMMAAGERGAGRGMAHEVTRAGASRVPEGTAAGPDAGLALGQAGYMAGPGSGHAGRGPMRGGPQLPGMYPPPGRAGGGGDESPPPPQPPLHGGGDVAGAWMCPGDQGPVGGEYGEYDDYDAEDEQLQAHLMSVGAPALLLSIQLEQMELYDRLRRLERLRRRLEALQQQQQFRAGCGVGGGALAVAPKMEAPGRRSPMYDSLLQYPAAAAMLDERIGGGGRGGGGSGNKRLRCGDVMPVGPVGVHRMADGDGYGGGYDPHLGLHENGGRLDPSRLAEVYAAAAAAVASDPALHLGRGQAAAAPPPPLVRLVHRGPPPASARFAGDARELAMAAEDDEAMYGAYGNDGSEAPPSAAARLAAASHAALRQQSPWQRGQRVDQLPPQQGWGRPAAGGGGAGGLLPHRDEMRAAAQYGMHLGGGGGGGSARGAAVAAAAAASAAAAAAYGRRQRGDEPGIPGGVGGGGGGAASRAADDDWE